MSKLIPSTVPPRAPGLWLRGQLRDRFLVMAIVNRTSDSFYPRARQLDDQQALAAVEQAASEGADIVDIGGVRAGRGPQVPVSDQLKGVITSISQVRRECPCVLTSVYPRRAR